MPSHSVTGVNKFRICLTLHSLKIMLVVQNLKEVCQTARKNVLKDCLSRVTVQTSAWEMQKTCGYCRRWNIKTMIKIVKSNKSESVIEIIIVYSSIFRMLLPYWITTKWCGSDLCVCCNLYLPDFHVCGNGEGYSKWRRNPPFQGIWGELHFHVWQISTQVIAKPIVFTLKLHEYEHLDLWHKSLN